MKCLKLASPQARTRLIILCSRRGPCDLWRHYQRRKNDGRARVSIAERTGMEGLLYLHNPNDGAARVVDCQTEPARTLLTSCLTPPSPRLRLHVRDRQRLERAGVRLSDVPRLNPRSAGQLMGFPADYPWPDPALRCHCPYCCKGRPAARKSDACSAGRQIGNAVPRELGRFVGEVLLRAEATRFSAGRDGK